MKTDERHFAFYDEPHNRLVNQVLLMEKLFEKGMETSKDGILSAKDGNISTTIFLLFMRDNIEPIIKEQRDILNNFEILSEISTNQLISDYEIEIIPQGHIESGMESRKWEHKKTYMTDLEHSISGSINLQRADYFTPIPPYPEGLNEYFGSRNPNVNIYNECVLTVIEGEVPKPSIHIFRYCCLFFDSTYALMQRVLKEQRKFKTKTGREIRFPPPKGQFNLVCEKRGAIFHGGNLFLSIEPETSEICVTDKKKPVAQLVETAFSEALAWVDEVYGKMLIELER